jgi:cytochrome c553
VPALYDQTIGEFYFKQGKPEPGPRDLLPDTHQAPATTLASINPKPPMPSQGGFSLDDIEQQQGIRDKWTAWQTRMQSDYDKVLGLNAAHELKIQAWDRFLATYKDDNPFSEQDHKLREQAQQNKKQTDTTKREPKHAQPLRPPQTFSVPVPRVSSSELSRLNFQDQIAEYDRLAGSLESTRPSDRAASSRGVWKDGGGEGDRASSLAAACNACHGRNGMSAGAIPSLAGLEQRYFVDQLKAFRDGSRPSTIMSKYASGYTDAEFVAMGKYYSSIKY